MADRAPPLKIGRLSRGAKLQLLVPALNRLSRSLLADPAEPVRVIVGKKAARAAPILASAPRSICSAAGRMSISAPVTPSAFISAQALDLVPSEVANPGMVKPKMLVRGRSSRSKARHATSRAWVESSPPETPITSAFAPVAVIRRIMEGAALPAVDLSVPLDVEAKAAGNWDDAH